MCGLEYLHSIDGDYTIMEITICVIGKEVFMCLSFLKVQLFSQAAHKRPKPRLTDPMAISQEEKVLNNLTLGLQILVYRSRMKVTILTYPLSEFLLTHQQLPVNND